MNPEESFKSPYDAGYDCGLHGANTINSNYRWFSTEMNMKMWSLGKHDGENEKFKIAIQQTQKPNS